MTFVNFHDVKAKVSITQIADWLGLKLQKAGEQLRGPCPLHNDGGKRSLVITPAKSVFYNFCPQCKCGGDAIALVSHIKGLSPRDAALEIARQFCLGEPEKPAQPKPAPRPESREGPLKPLDYLEAEHENVAALGLSPATCQHFGAGYAGKGIMRGRLAIPIHDQKGTLLAYCGRALKDEGLTFPKGFAYECVLFNAHRIAEGDFVYLVRDPLQVLLAYQNGIENVVAFLGEVTSDALQVLALWMDENDIKSIDLL